MSVIAITGGGGMIGRHLVDALRSFGAKVRVLLLPGEAVPSNFNGIEIERGDIRSREDLNRLMAGAEITFHLAALVGRDANRVSLELARDVNVEGTRKVIEEAKRQQSRLVFLSTCCVYGLYSTEEELVDEQWTLAPLPLPYDLSKTEAERLITSEDPSTLAWSILEIPVALGGEHTIDKPTVLSMVKLAMMRLIPVPISGQTWVNYVFGRDVADALILMARHPAAIGQRFIFSESLPFKDFFSIIAPQIGRRVISVPIPNFALNAAARTHQATTVLTNRRRFSAQKIRARLGFEPSVGLARGLERTLSHYQTTGLILSRALS